MLMKGTVSVNEGDCQTKLMKGAVRQRVNAEFIRGLSDCVNVLSSACVCMCELLNIC